MNNLFDKTAKPSDSMKKIIEKLNISKLKIVLIVGESNELIGTVTDGDIRRALLALLNMDSCVSEFMNKNPISAKKTDSKTLILSIMKENGIMQIPIVDENMVVSDVHTLKDLVAGERFDNPIFLMAGGFGTRLRPLTDKTPKPLLKVGTKPILEIILEGFINSGFHNFYFSTHYKADLIKSYFGDGSRWGVSITYVSEETPLGTAGALSLLPKFKSSAPIIMMNGDILTKVDVNQLLDFHNEKKASATMCVREHDYSVPYGVVTANKDRVMSIVEKPVYKFFINAGIYVLNTEVVSKIPASTVLDMPDLLNQIIQETSSVNMFPVHEYWLDIGQIDQFNKAQIDVERYFHD